MKKSKKKSRKTLPPNCIGTDERSTCLCGKEISPEKQKEIDDNFERYIGVSAWREEGKRRNYWQFFEDEVKEKILEEVKVAEGKMYGGGNYRRIMDGLINTIKDL